MYSKDHGFGDTVGKVLATQCSKPKFTPSASMSSTGKFRIPSIREEQK